MSLMSYCFKLNSYKRLVYFKYRAFLSTGNSVMIQSLADDLDTLCKDYTTEISIQELAGLVRSSDPPATYHSNIALAINKCNNMYSLYQLLFLIDPIAAESVPE
jgi:hypothetical protein